jgi:hypothetical protein
MSLVLTVWLMSPVWGETIELTNGEMIDGKVISMDAANIQVETREGQLQTIPRERIAQIMFGERADVTRSFSITQMLREMRAEGLNEEAWRDIEQRIRVIQTPELKRYLENTVAGLQKDLQRLREDAEEVQREITALREEYGPDADTLNAYLVAIQQILGGSAQVPDARVQLKVTVDDENDAEASGTERPRTDTPRPGTAGEGAPRLETPPEDAPPLRTPATDQPAPQIR